MKTLITLLLLITLSSCSVLCSTKKTHYIVSVDTIAVKQLEEAQTRTYYPRTYYPRTYSTYRSYRRY